MKAVTCRFRHSVLRTDHVAPFVGRDSAFGDFVAEFMNRSSWRCNKCLWTAERATSINLFVFSYSQSQLSECGALNITEGHWFLRRKFPNTRGHCQVRFSEPKYEYSAGTTMHKLLVFTEKRLVVFARFFHEVRTMLISLTALMLNF